MDKALVYGTRDSGFDPQRSRVTNLVFSFESPPTAFQTPLDRLALLNYRCISRAEQSIHTAEEEAIRSMELDKATASCE
jgi:hypothetical protein